MSTVIRPEISKKNLYWIPKHRYYELKHFCLQYPEWKKNYRRRARMERGQRHDRPVLHQPACKREDALPCDEPYCSTEV